MKAIIIGASGTIGRPTAEKFREAGYEVIGVGRRSGDVQADLTDAASIKAMFEKVGKVDVVLNLGGEAPFRTIEQVTDEDVENVSSAIAGTVNLVRFALPYLNDGGAVVLTTGSTVLDPIPIASITCAMGGAINQFVRGAALSMPRNISLSCVLPPLVAETAEMEGIPGEWISATEVAGWYQEAIASEKSGQWRTTEGWSNFQTGGLGWDADELLVEH